MGPLCAQINKQWKIHTYTQENTWRTLTHKVQRHMHECHFCPHHTNMCSKFKNDLWLLPPVNSLCAVGCSLISKSWQTHLKQRHMQSCVSFFIAAPYEDPAAPFIWPENVFTRSPNKSESYSLNYCESITNTLPVAPLRSGVSEPTCCLNTPL